MARRVRGGYQIVFGPVAAMQLRALRERQRGAYTMVLDGVERQLRHQPAMETRNRKPTEPGAEAPWELRLPPYRVYYEVDEDARFVRVVGIAHKPRETAVPLPAE